jgi:hypothetical protein
MMPALIGGGSAFAFLLLLAIIFRFTMAAPGQKEH